MKSKISGLTYAQSGVDIDAGNKLIDNIEEKKIHLNDQLIQQKLLDEKIDITEELIINGINFSGCCFGP